MAKAESSVAGMKYLAGETGFNEVMAKVTAVLEKLSDTPGVVTEVQSLVGWMKAHYESRLDEANDRIKVLEDNLRETEAHLQAVRGAS